MASIDLIILIVVLVSALIGLARGLLKEVLSLATWLAAFLLALYFGPAVAERLAGQITDGAVRLIVGFLVVFLSTLLAGGLAQWLARALVQSTGLSGTDRFLGFLFGGARGLVAALVVLIVVNRFADADDWWSTSVLVPGLLAFEQDLLALLGRAQEWVTQLGNGG
jgi:membrane protein required for colicin V production